MQFPQLNDLPTIQLYRNQLFENRETFVLFDSTRDVTQGLWIDLRSPRGIIRGTIERIVRKDKKSWDLRYLYNRNRKILLIHELYHNDATDEYVFRQALFRNFNLRVLKSKSELVYKEH